MDVPAKARKPLVRTMLERVRLNGKENRFPHELSGGQQQRIALARALAPRPRLLLMDEPFSNLDVELRETLGVEVRDLLRASGTTCLLVTHDQQDAFTFSDKVGVMNEGRIEQWDSAYAMYHEPASRFVADFIGQGVFLDGRVVDENLVETELAMLSGKVPTGCKPGCPVKVLVRPDDVVHNDDSALTARIVSRNFRGSSYLYTLELESGTQILSMVHSHHNHELGEQLGIQLELDHLVVFPDEEARHASVED
jgi:iron(III) transport system ATP-binding protein